MSLLIKNVQIVDGEGGEPYKADVYIQNNLISAIGNLKNKHAKEQIDGLGNYLTPGFIDIDSSSDQYLSIFTNPKQQDFVNQGVTTIIGGHCGASLAPLLYGTLESIRKWADTSKINIDWHSMGEFLKVLDKFKLGVNFGSMVGHATIRRSITGGSSTFLNTSEMKVFKKILHKAMDEGAFGLSTGLGYAHGRQVPYAEIEELVNVVKKYDGVYSTHLRSETSGLIGAVEETVKIAEGTGVKAIISHFRPLIGFEAQFGEAMNRISQTQDNLRFYVYPYDTSIVPVYTILPLWAQEKDFEAMLRKIRNPEDATRIESELAGFPMERITIAEAPGHNYFVGKTIDQIAEMFNLSPIKALIRLMDTTNLRVMIFNKNIEFDMLLDLLTNDKAFIASNAASRGEKDVVVSSARSLGTFPDYLDIVVNKKGISINKAIKKITSEPANFFGIKDRGIIKEGMVADLVVLSKDNLNIKNTIVGGRVDSPEGKILRHTNQQ